MASNAGIDLGTAIGELVAEVEFRAQHGPIRLNAEMVSHTKVILAIARIEQERDDAVRALREAETRIGRLRRAVRNLHEYTSDFERKLADLELTYLEPDDLYEPDPAPTVTGRPSGDVEDAIAATNALFRGGRSVRDVLGSDPAPTVTGEVDAT